MKRVVVFEPSGLRLSVKENTTVLEAIRKTGLHVSSNCGGKGTCGKCSITVYPVPNTAPSDIEHLSSIELENGKRLACQHIVIEDMRVVLPDHQRELKILSEGKTVEKQWKLDAGVENQLGVAIDLGTTTIVAYLLDLNTGTQLGQNASLNPQVAYGEDVMSRITYALRKGGAEELSDIVVTEISDLISQLIRTASIDSDRLSRVSLVGNTAMHHLFLKADVKPLGVAPYEPTIRDAVNTTGHSVGLLSSPKAKVYLPPNIAGFVGGDTVGFILSQRLDLTDKVILGIDVGTNGEIVLSNQGDLSCCSTAAGSAFEGATIRHGMRGESGAIEYIAIENPDDPPDMSVIGGGLPQGLCGSAIVDVTAELIHTSILDSKGRLQSISNRVSDDAEFGLSYIITTKEESGAKRDIVFTQKDVRQVQLAKGAIQSGSSILLREASLGVQDIDFVMLAGAFGSYIRPESALTIGLFPHVDVDKVIQVGNAAGEGAKTLLLSSESRKHMEVLVPNIQYLELANQDDFQSVFIESLKFPE